MKQRKLNYRFHNPNSAEDTANFLCKLLIEANAGKVERAIEEAAARCAEDCEYIAEPEEIEKAKQYGRNLGIIFQIRDDIFDYYESKEIGKPTGNDMAEGKLTLPAIYAVNHDAPAEIRELAYKVKDRSISTDEIGKLVAYTKANGGIEYAERRMWEFHDEACHFIDTYIHQDDIRQALRAYLDYVIKRNK